MREGFSESSEKFLGKYAVDKDGYVMFGDIAHGELDTQTQYASRYINGVIEGYPKLGEGLRFVGDPEDDYHAVRIHKDDALEFIARIKNARGF